MKLIVQNQHRNFRQNRGESSPQRKKTIEATLMIWVSQEKKLPQQQLCKNNFSLSYKHHKQQFRKVLRTLFTSNKSAPFFYSNQQLLWKSNQFSIVVLSCTLFSLLPSNSQLPTTKYFFFTFLSQCKAIFFDNWLNSCKNLNWKEKSRLLYSSK